MKGEGVTFGCLNNFCKVSEAVLEVWSRILLAVPRSRLMLHAPAGSARELVRSFMAARGVAADRCRFVDLLPFDRYLQTYHEMDIGLDTFPYAVGTTTCDALYMGVPVVTLAGRTGVGRSGVSLLSQLDLGKCVAETMEEYVQIAAGLAGDLERLAALRGGLRARMLNSRLMDGGAFARNFEAVLRGAWRRWCEKPSG